MPDRSLLRPHLTFNDPEKSERYLSVLAGYSIPGTAFNVLSINNVREAIRQNFLRQMRRIRPSGTFNGYSNQLKEWGMQAGAKGPVAYYPFGGFDPYTPFTLIGGVSDVFAMGIENFGSIKDVIKFCGKNRIFGQVGGAGFRTFDSFRDMEMIIDDEGVSGLGAVAMARIMAFLNGEIEKVSYFTIKGNGDLRFLTLEELEDEENYNNAVIEFKVKDPHTGMLVKKRYWYIRHNVFTGFMMLHYFKNLGIDISRLEHALLKARYLNADGLIQPAILMGRDTFHIDFKASPEMMDKIYYKLLKSYQDNLYFSRFMERLRFQTMLIKAANHMWDIDKGDPEEFGYNPEAYLETLYAKTIGPSKRNVAQVISDNRTEGMYHASGYCPHSIWKYPPQVIPITDLPFGYSRKGYHIKGDDIEGDYIYYGSADLLVDKLTGELPGDRLLRKDMVLASNDRLKAPEGMIAEPGMLNSSGDAILGILNTEHEGMEAVVYDELAIGSFPTEELAEKTRGRAHVFGIGMRIPSYKILYKRNIIKIEYGKKVERIQDIRSFFDKDGNLLYIIDDNRIIKVDLIDRQLKSEIEMLNGQLKTQAKDKRQFSDEEGNEIAFDLNADNLSFVEADMFNMDKARVEKNIPLADVVRIVNNNYTTQDIESVLKALSGSVNENGHVFIGRKSDVNNGEEECLVYRKKEGHFVLKYVMVSVYLRYGILDFGIGAIDPSIGHQLNGYLFSLLGQDEKFSEELKEFKNNVNNFINPDWHEKAREMEKRIASRIVPKLRAKFVVSSVFGSAIMIGKQRAGYEHPIPILADLEDIDFERLGFHRYAQKGARRGNNATGIKISKRIGGNREGGVLQAPLFSNEAWIYAGDYAYKVWVENGQLFLQPYDTETRNVPAGEVLKGNYTRESVFVVTDIEPHFSVTLEKGLSYYYIKVEDFESEDGTRVEWIGREDWVTENDKERPAMPKEKDLIKMKQVDLANLPAGSLVYLSNIWVIRSEGNGMVRLWRTSDTGSYYGHAELLGSLFANDITALPDFIRDSAGRLKDYVAGCIEEKAFTYFKVYTDRSQAASLAEVINGHRSLAVCP